MFLYYANSIGIVVLQRHIYEGTKINIFKDYIIHVFECN